VGVGLGGRGAGGGGGEAGRAYCSRRTLYKINIEIIEVIRRLNTETAFELGVNRIDIFTYKFFVEC
jgi:hypothetical protein